MRASTPDLGDTDLIRGHRDYALLFATNEYDSWQPLINPIPDAEAIAQELKENYQFETEIVRNPTRERIVSKLREYAKKPFSEADQLFIFFAGHGLYDDVFKQGFLVAKDSKMDDETRGTYESYDDLRTIVNAMRKKHILLVMDACYSGTFDRRIGEAGMRGNETYANFSLPELFANKVRLSTRKYLTSGGRDYVPDGDPNHHSPFAAHLLEALRSYGGSQGYLTFSGILNAVEETKPQPYWGEWGDNHPGSEFLFISKRMLEALNKKLGPVTEAIKASPRAEGTALPEKSRLSIAVMGFKNLGGKSEDSWLSTALSEWLSTEVAASEKLRIITGEDVARTKSDLELADSSGYTKSTLQRLYKALGSDYVVSGAFVKLGGSSEGKIRVDLRLQNAQTGETVGVAAETGAQADLSELVRRSASRLNETLGIQPLSRAEAAAASAGLSESSEATRYYAEGLIKSRTYDLLGARDLLQRSIAADPKFALAHQALARTWSELGYDSKAKQEAANAMDLASNLPLQARLTIEASYRQVTAEWDRAADIYGSLWKFFPDESDYGLRLAEVQIAAGKAKDALAILDKLRASSKRASDDPRIDFQEATAAGMLSDFKRQQEAAQRSASKAATQGARLLVAQASWQNCSALAHLGDQQGAEAACSQASQAANFAGGRQEQARSLTVLANVQIAEGKNSEAMENREDALRIARQIGSRRDIIGALMNLANSQLSDGRMSEASEGYEEAKKLAKEIGDKAQLILLDGNWADTLYAKGDYNGARQGYEDSLNAAREIGDKLHAAIALQNLALVVFQLGNLAQAEKNVNDAITTSRECGAKAVEASSLGMQGDILMARADLPASRKAYQEALNLFTKINDQPNVAASRLSLANLCLEDGNPQEAEKLAREAVDEFQREKIVDLEVSARETLTRALVAEGKLEEAQAEIESAKKLPAEDRSIRLSVEITAARVNAKNGKSADAEKALRSAFEAATNMHLLSSQLEIRLMQAELEATSNPKSAREHLQSLQHDARLSGYSLVASKAAKIQPKL